MALNLSDATTGSSAFVGGISIDNLTWWFWVKAGIGFTLGAGIMTFTAVIVWWTAVAIIALTAFSHFGR